MGSSYALEGAEHGVIGVGRADTAEKRLRPEAQPQRREQCFAQVHDRSAGSRKSSQAWCLGAFRATRGSTLCHFRVKVCVHVDEDQLRDGGQ